MLAVIFFGKNMKIMLSITNYVKNYASTIYKSLKFTQPLSSKLVDFHSPPSTLCRLTSAPRRAEQEGGRNGPQKQGGGRNRGEDVGRREKMKCWEWEDIDEKETFYILAMKMLAKATAIFIPMAVPWVYRQLLRQNLDDYSVNIEYFRHLVGIGALSLPWLRPLRRMLVQRRSSKLSQARTKWFCIRHPIMAFLV